MSKSLHQIVLNEHDRNEAIASLRQYFDQNMPDPLGVLPANLLLDFVLEEIAPLVYNRAVQDAQQRVLARTADLDGELHLDPFQYWARIERRKQRR